MSPHVAAIVVLLGIGVSAHAAAESYFSEKGFDFGPTPRGPRLTHQFQFTNKGKEPVLIVRVRASCTCLTAFAPAQRIMPGESANVTVHMDTRRFSGSKSETIYVTFKEPKEEEVALKIQANAREEFVLSADKIAFGMVRPGAVRTASIQATLAGDPKWEISEVKSESEFIKASAKLVKRSGNEVSFEIAATLRPGLAVGRWETDIWLKTTNADVGKVRIPVSVEVAAAYSATPSEIAFGEVKVGTPAEKSVFIRGEKPFRIKASKGADSGIEVTGITNEMKLVHVLKVIFKPSKAANVNRTIELIVDDGDQAVRVVVTGKGE